MHLNEFTVRILRTLLIAGRHCASGAHDRIRRFAEDEPWTTGGDDHCISRERFQLERLQIHRNQSATDLMIVEYERHHFPVLKFSNFPCDLVATHLFIECIKKLLSS